MKEMTSAGATSVMKLENHETGCVLTLCDTWDGWLRSLWQAGLCRAAKAWSRANYRAKIKRRVTGADFLFRFLSRAMAVPSPELSCTRVTVSKPKEKLSVIFWSTRQFSFEILLAVKTCKFAVDAIFKKMIRNLKTGEEPRILKISQKLKFFRFFSWKL